MQDPYHRPKDNAPEINSDGIRCGREADAFHPQDLNFVFLGDSFTYGMNEYPHLVFPQQFETMLREKNPDLSINVANFGWVSSSPYLSFRLLKDIGAKYNPDVVFLCIDMTDFHDDLKYQHLIERPKFIYRVMSLLPGTVLVSKKALAKLTRFRPFENLHDSVFGIPKDRFFVTNQPLEESRPFCDSIVANIDAIEQYVTQVQ